MQDRYIKFMLTLVAGLLAANLFALAFKSSSSPAELFVSAAHAQDANVNTPAPSSQNITVKALKGFMVQDLKDVVAVGDGKSFVVSNPKGFMVYQVGPLR
jgi:hypothetical protein